VTNPVDLPNPIDPMFWLRDGVDIDADIARLHAEAPLAFMDEPVPPPALGIPQGPGSWVVTEHAQILEMSKTPEVFSSAKGITVADRTPESGEFLASMIDMDDPRHARLRKVVSAGFTPRHLRSLEDSVQTIAREIVDEAAEKRSVDFIVDVAAALPLKIVCDLMGIPRSQYEFVFDRTNIILGAGDPEYVLNVENVIEVVMGAAIELGGLMSELAETKRGGDDDDLTTAMVNAEIDGERLSDAELASFFILLVVAGNETTRNAIGWGLKYLTDNPDQRALWQSDFETHASHAVEEIVRLASPVAYMRRTATRDCELSGTQISEGEKLCMFYIAANRDPQVFTDPSRFDITRAPNPHVGFGGPGPHFCLGAHLARREITVMFRELFGRFSNIEATGPPHLLVSSFIHGIKHLDAELTPA
jgi:cytochrome P450